MKNIKTLNEKFWSGETTLEEELQLKEYYHEHPELKGPEQSIFSYFDQERSYSYTREIKMPTPLITRLAHRIIPLAATVILVFGALWGFNKYNSTPANEIVIDDPQMALQITREAFALLNSQVDRGEQALKENIVHLDKTFIFKN